MIFLNLEKAGKHLAAGLAGLAIVLGAAAALNDFIFHLAFLYAGLYLLGFFLPYVVDEWTGFGHTLWVPAGLLALFVAGMAVSIGSNIIVALTSTTYCGIPPCANYGIVILALVLGSVAHLVVWAWTGHELDLLGERVSERHEKKHGKPAAHPA